MLKLIMALAATGAGLGVILLAGMLFLRHALEGGDGGSGWRNAE